MVSLGARRQQSSWTPPTPDRRFQWNKLVGADGSGLSRRNRLESFANFWQKQLRMYLETHFPLYWTLLNCAVYRPSPKKPIFSPVQPFLRLNRGVNGLTVYTHADHQQHTCFCPQCVRDRIQLLQHEPGQFKPQTRLSMEGDPNSASVDSSCQVKSFGLVHVVSVHDQELFWGVMSFLICRLYRQN